MKSAQLVVRTRAWARPQLPQVPAATAGASVPHVAAVRGRRTRRLWGRDGRACLHRGLGGRAVRLSESDGALAAHRVRAWRNRSGAIREASGSALRHVIIRFLLLPLNCIARPRSRMLTCCCSPRTTWPCSSPASGRAAVSGLRWCSGARVSAFLQATPRSSLSRSHVPRSRAAWRTSESKIAESIHLPHLTKFCLHAYTLARLILCGHQDRAPPTALPCPHRVRNRG